MELGAWLGDEARSVDRAEMIAQFSRILAAMGGSRADRGRRPEINSFGHLLHFTTWGESHGPAIGAVVDGYPPGIALSEADVQLWLDQRRPGLSKHTSPRQEPDKVRILSGVFEGRTTGTPISLMIDNVDARSGDYPADAPPRPGHADFAYQAKYGIRDIAAAAGIGPETAARVAAGAVEGWSFPK